MPSYQKEEEAVCGGGGGDRVTERRDRDVGRRRWREKHEEGEMHAWR